MKFYKRLLAMAIVATVFISVFAFGATAYGSDNDIPFYLRVPGSKGKVYSDAEHRGDSGTEVPWKVDFSFSEEGKGTIMNFLLSGPWYSEQSYTHSVHQGSGNRYYAVYQNCKIWMLDLLYLITIMLVLNIMLQVTGMKKQINTAFHTNKFSVFDNYC